MVILGAGESGAGAAVLAKAKGFDVFVSDKSSIKPKYKEMLDNHGIRWEEGQHTEADILNADEIVKSPGIPDKAPIIQLLKKQGTPIISEIEFAGRYTDSKMICITGSNGKTTTTMLTYHILKEAGVDVGLAGNVGNSLALQVAEDPHAVYVIELSSFQLDNMYDFKADIAIILNITPDHLDRYNYEMQNYVDAKFRILQNDYSEIEELVNKKVHSLIFMGVDNTKLHAFFDGKVANIEDARSMEEAVAKAYKMAHKGDTVLLSPCCASFDLFKSYEDRGDQFKACVRNL